MKRLALTLVGLASAIGLASCDPSSPGDSGDGRGGATASGGATAGSGGAGAAPGGRSGSGGGVSGSGAATAGSGGSSASGGEGPSSGGGTGAGSGGEGGATSAGGGGAGGAGARVGTGGGGGGGRAAATGGAGGETGGSAGAGGAGTGTGGTPGNLPPGVTAMFPPPGGQGICPDPSLRLTFSGAPTLGTSGKIQVFDSGGTAVASVDLSASTVMDTIGGTAFVLVKPIYVDGNSAVIYLRTKALAYGRSYYVTVDAGAIKPPGGGTLAITGTSAWRFATRAAAPTNLSALTVALDGAGPFCTVQGATDALPANNTAASTITINAGVYHEIMHVSRKSNITLHGQDRAATIIEGTNNNMQQAGNNPGTANRALLGFDGTNGLVIENLTIHNLTTQDGTQAEALRLASCDKCIIRDANIISLQDTLLWDGRLYADNALIAGNVDYVWGTGVAYFNKCEIRTVGRSGVIVQSRNAPGAYGYVFVDSKLTTDAASKNNLLARIDVSAYPGSHVAFINCQMTNIAAAGWTVTGGSPTSALRFWEYQSTDASGNALGASGRLAGLTPITAAQAATMRDPTMVLGGWQPQ